MLGRPGLTDLEESCHQSNRQTLVGSDLGNDMNLSKWALAAELWFVLPPSLLRSLGSCGEASPGQEHRLVA